MSNKSYIGKGKCHVKKLGVIGAKRRFVGNVSKLDSSITENRVDQMDYTTAGGGLADSVSRATGMELAFVMHNFMDAAVVRPAWELLQRGEMSAEPEVRAAQERLQACSYAMAHPESDMLVPACAQHGVLDPEENKELVVLLPMAG